jgi:flagellar biosynthesis GTPase FlhF
MINQIFYNTPTTPTPINEIFYNTPTPINETLYKKYNIEGNINFYDELYNSLHIDDDEEDNDDSNCMITGLPLTNNFVTLECKHKFNYDALYKEIYKQKFDFKTYKKEHLTKKQVQQVLNSGKDYFIKCPYCRNIQFTLLPYYENENKPIYGINSDEKQQQNTVTSNYSYTKYGYIFSFGCKCHNEKCLRHLVTLFNSTNNIFYCSKHVGEELKKQKQAIKEQKIKQKQEQIKQKQEQIKQKQEQIKQKQAIKEQKIKQKEEQIKQKQEQIKQKQAIKEQKIKQKQEQIKQKEEQKQTNKCSKILVSGINKGKQCSAKIFENGLCKRHCKNILKIK